MGGRWGRGCAASPMTVFHMKRLNKTEFPILLIFMYSLFPKAILFDFYFTHLLSLKKTPFECVISITCSVFVGTSWNLQIRWIWIKSRTSSKTDYKGSLIIELRILDCWKSLYWLCHRHSSFSFHWIFLKLTITLKRKLCSKLHYCLWGVSIKPILPFSNP